MLHIPEWMCQVNLTYPKPGVVKCSSMDKMYKLQGVGRTLRLRRPSCESCNDNHYLYRKKSLLQLSDYFYCFSYPSYSLFKHNLCDICWSQPLKFEDLLLFIIMNGSSWTADWTNEPIWRHQGKPWEIMSTFFKKKNILKFTICHLPTAQAGWYQCGSQSSTLSQRPWTYTRACWCPLSRCTWCVHEPHGRRMGSLCIVTK